MNISSKNIIQDDMLVHIYANTVLKTLAILINKPVSARLTSLEFDMQEQRLYIVINGERRDMCNEIHQDIVPLLFGRDSIDVFQVDFVTKEPVNGFKAPLKTLVSA